VTEKGNHLRKRKCETLREGSTPPKGLARAEYSTVKKKVPTRGNSRETTGEKSNAQESRYSRELASRQEAPIEATRNRYVGNCQRSAGTRRESKVNKEWLRRKKRHQQKKGGRVLVSAKKCKRVADDVRGQRKDTCAGGQSSGASLRGSSKRRGKTSEESYLGPGKNKAAQAERTGLCLTQKKGAKGGGRTMENELSQSGRRAKKEEKSEKIPIVGQTERHGRPGDRNF